MKIFYSACPSCKSKDIKHIFQVKDFTVSNESFEVWQCDNCTLRFTQSAPGKESIESYYKSENYISHSDTKKGFINLLYHKVRTMTLKSKFSLIKKHTGITTGNILDVGSGTGAFLNIMQKGNWLVTGLEPDLIARENAKELYGLDFLNSDSLFHLQENSFDAITLWHVLEHVHDLHEYISQLKKLLKPAGLIFIAVPNYTCYDEKVYKNFWAAYDVPRHLYHFSPQSVKQLLSGYDLKLKDIIPMWFDSFYVSLLSEKYNTGKNNYLKAVSTGIISNCKVLFNKEKCSSEIYITGK